MINLLRRVWYLVNRSRRERELVREMDEHRDQMRDASRFGNTHRLIEQSRDAWGWNWLDDALQDLAVGMRTLLRAPSFAITAVLILSFGIGLNVTLYQMIYVAMLRPPSVSSPETLLRFHRNAPESNSTSVPVPLAEFARDHTRSLSAVMLESGTAIGWGRDATEQIEASFVSTNWFRELGYGPQHGRMFNETDNDSDTPNVVVSHAFWRANLGASASVVGTTVYVDRKPVTVVGVAPASLPGLDYDVPDVYIPLKQRQYFYPTSAFLFDWNLENTAMYGRLRDGVSPAAAREELRGVMKAAAAEHPEVKADEWLEPLLATENFMKAEERIQVMAAVALIAALTGLVLLVAAANLGNLVMSRATGRVREFGVRMALGANRSRIVRQLVIEAVPLVAFGALGSLVFAMAAASLVATLADFPPYFDFSIGWRTALLAFALAAISLIVVGLLPAWKVAQQHLIDAIKDGGQSVTRNLDRVLLRRVMVAAQVAGTCVLLIVAGMMVRSVQRLVTTDLGFDYKQTAVLSMPLGRHGISGDEAYAYWHAVKERIAQNPEVEHAAIVTTAPLGGRIYQTSYKDAPNIDTLVQGIDPEYFAVMRIPIIAGRLFGPGDAKTAIVSRRLAMEMYGTIDVLGRGFPKSEPRTTIVGVAADAHTIKLEAPNVSELYLPLERSDFSTVVIVARARGDVDRLPPILKEAASLDSRVIPVAHAMHEDFDRHARGPRTVGALASAIGLLTLMLACLGIFGVVSYGVALRTKEIGIRAALGAQQSALLRAILRQVLTPVGVGVIVGLVIAVPLGSALSGEPFYLQNVDPVAYAGALTIFASAGAAAAF